MVETGLVRAIEQGALKGLRVGAICNPTSVDANLRHLADLLHEAEGVTLAALFGPEHGVRGDVQYLEEVHGTVDPRTGVPEHSLYGQDFASLTPRDEHLKDLDALVFDIQDVGSRYYTYLATMGLCMQAAARNKLRFVVLDRPNPIGGAAVEGGIIHPGFESFVGLWPIAARHGLTAGECALLLKREFGIDCELGVMQMEGWQRDMLFDQTGLPWVLPSPNMPSLDTALVYPGLCLLEGTNLSEGRGTTKPFELFGAPWLDGQKLAEALDAEQLPGVRFRPCAFTPTWDKHRGARCQGVQIHIWDRRALEPVRLGVACIVHARAQDPAKFAWRTEKYEFVETIPAIDLLAGSDTFRRAVEAGQTVDALCEPWEAECAEFVTKRASYLLY
ncbi:MAG: exo-beta-N-acetylmuramidase NamZ domain-containing protein [Myxococcales bacterium]